MTLFLPLLSGLGKQREACLCFCLLNVTVMMDSPDSSGVV